MGYFIQNTLQLMLLILPPCHSMVRMCYFSTWARYRTTPFNMQAEDVDPRLCTHVILAFAWITDGNLTLHSKNDDQKLVFGLTDLKKINPKLKILAAVGGWNFGSEPFKKITATKKSRIRFAKSAVNFLHHWRLDGLDLDWEYPDWADRQKFALLVRLLNKAFLRDSKRNSKDKFLLTAAVTASKSKMGGYDVQKIKHALDYVNVMTYDFNGPWADTTGHNAALQSWDSLNVESGIALWENAGLPKEKIVVGIPMYGHSFKLTEEWTPELGAKSNGGVPGPVTKEKGFFAYYEVCDFIADERTDIYWDEHALVPYAVNNNTWVSYDDETSVQIKTNWTISKGYGGVMVWSLAMDDFSGTSCRPNVTFPLLKAINTALGIDIDEYEPVEQDNKISVNNRRKAVRWQPEEQWEEDMNLEPGEPTPQEWDTGDECDWQSLKPQQGRDCIHFLVCERGYLHEFECPEKLAFNPEFGICMWPWEVKGCGHISKVGKSTTTPKPNLGDYDVIQTSPATTEYVTPITAWPVRVIHTVSNNDHDHKNDDHEFVHVKQ